MFDRPGLEIGFLQADQDLSDESHQFTAVWVGVGTSPTAVSGNAAILKPGTQPSGGTSHGSGSSSTPAPKQQDSFTLADSDLTVGTAYGFDIGGQTVSVTAQTGQTVTQLLNAVGTAAEGKDANITFTVTDSAGTGKLQINATTNDAITFANFSHLTHTSDQPAPPAGSGSGSGSSSSGSSPAAGEIKGPAFGILQNRPIQGEAANVMTSGVSVARAGGDWQPGDLLGTDDEGALVKVTSGQALGLAIEAATEGDLSNILLLPRSAA